MYFLFDKFLLLCLFTSIVLQSIILHVLHAFEPLTVFAINPAHNNRHEAWDCWPSPLSMNILFMVNNGQLAPVYLL